MSFEGTGQVTFLVQIKKFQELLLDFINGENNQNEIDKLISDLISENNHFKIKEYLNMISNIANNHYRSTNFFSKIEHILISLKDIIKQTFLNFELFKIFKENKRILLFLLKQQFITIDKQIALILSQNPYYDYFCYEILSYYKDGKINCKEDELEDFEKKRQIGENDKYICKLIRDDSIVDFITYISKNEFSTNSIISPSKFETNSFLLSHSKTTLIQYAAFYGSIRIFDYLAKNEAITNSSLWLYAIHGQNPEIIHFLEENKIEFPIYDETNDNYNPDNEEIKFNNLNSLCLAESIKCHHNNITNFIIDNFECQKDEVNNEIFNSYNFLQFPNDELSNHLNEIIENGHTYLLEMLLKESDIEKKFGIFKTFFLLWYF